MTDVVLPDDEVFTRFLAAADEGSLDANADQTSIDIIARILRATTPADVLGREDVLHARDFLDVPFTLLGVKFNRSEYDGSGPTFYALLDGANGDGEPLKITCGAKNVIAQAWKLLDLEALPIKVILKQSAKATSAGFHVMWLEAAGADF